MNDREKAVTSERRNEGIRHLSGKIMTPRRGKDDARVPLTSGTSLIAVMILAVPGTATQALLGNINWIAGIAVACGSIPGATLGAKLIPKVPERQLRFLFAGFLVVAAVLLVVNQLGVWG